MRRVASEMDCEDHSRLCVSFDSTRAQGSQIETHHDNLHHADNAGDGANGPLNPDAGPWITTTLQRAVKHPKASTSSSTSPSCLDAEPQICCGHEFNGERFGFVDFMVWFRRHHGLTSSTWSDFVNMVELLRG